MISANDEWRRGLSTFFQRFARGEFDSLHLLGVGNVIRHDDGVGVFIVDELRKKFASASWSNITIHPPTDAPEIALSRLKLKGIEVLIFDSIEHKSEPGAIAFKKLSSSRFGYFSTHDVPLKVYTELSEMMKGVFVLGIEPENLEIGEGLSESVQKSAHEIIRLVSTFIEKPIEKVSVRKAN